MDNIGDVISKYGFPIIAAGGMGYFIYYIYKWTTEIISPVIGESNKILIGLIDRIRRLDNDLIRLNQKLKVAIMLKAKSNYKVMDMDKFEEEMGKATVKRRD